MFKVIFCAIMWHSYAVCAILLSMCIMYMCNVSNFVDTLMCMSFFISTNFVFLLFFHYQIIIFALAETANKEEETHTCFCVHAIKKDNPKSICENRKKNVFILVISRKKHLSWEKFPLFRHINECYYCCLVT